MMTPLFLCQAAALFSYLPAQRTASYMAFTGASCLAYGIAFRAPLSIQQNLMQGSKGLLQSCTSALEYFDKIAEHCILETPPAESV